MERELAAEAIGYIFRTDCATENWSYIGQSTRLDQIHIAGYFGSGFNFKRATVNLGPDTLQKRILATAQSQRALHYLEMLHIADARRSGAILLNGDFGGPRPFAVFQRYLENLLPGAIWSAIEPERFYQLIARNRPLVEQAILDTLSAEGEDFYDGLERDIRALEDLSQGCPSCGVPEGAVCRTNARSDSKPHNPTWNHKARTRVVDERHSDISTQVVSTDRPSPEGSIVR